MTVLYGGTFDPPHTGHTAALRAALAQLAPDRTLVIPAAEPPHKALTAMTAGAEARLAMAKLAVADMENVSVSDVEMRREGKSYTVDTLRALAEELPGERFTVLMGTDMIETFETWKDFRAILGMARLGVFTRADDDEPRVRRAADALRAKYGADVVFIPHEAVEISSTELREALPRRGGREFLAEGVYAYIIRNRLYGAEPELAWLREQAYAMLKPKRIPHVQGTEEEAARLAARWGADVDKAREAAILHDITKKEDYNAQLLLCDKYGIILDHDERRNEKLLHAKTGAAVARDVFGVGDDIYNAIYWHTTGKADMTLLEKIVYLADYIEPTRDFEGVDTLRDIARRDLDAAVLKGLRMSIEEIKSRGVVPHDRTLEAAAWLARERGE